MDTADWLIAALASEGIDTLFGNPGSTELPLVDAFARQDRVRYVLGLHEMSVVGMAEGYAQITGTTAAVNVHVQPGIANALSGILNASRSRIPMLVTVGQQVTTMLDEQAFLGGDVLSSARPFVKGVWDPRDPDALVAALPEALLLARTPPYGPVVVSLPMDVLVSDAPSRAHVPVGWGAAPSAQAHEIDALVAHLARAQSPALLVGDGVAHAAAGDLVCALSERLGAPMLGEPWANVVAVHANHALWAGGVPIFGTQIRERLDACDCVLALGMPTFRLFGSSPGPTLDPHTELLVLDEGPADLSAGVTPAVSICAQMRDTVQRVLEALGPQDSAARDRRRRAVASVGAGRRQARAGVGPNRVDCITPSTFARAIAAMVGPGDIIVDESLTSGRALRTVMGARGPGSWFGHRGSALGWALPAAVGMAIAQPRKRVICLHGDGSILFGIHSLWSAAHLGVPLGVVVADNQGYEILRAGMEGMTGRATGKWEGLSIQSPAVDIAEIARGFGASAASVVDPAELAAALTDLKLRMRGGPAVLVVRVGELTPAIGYPIAPLDGAPPN